MVAGQKFMQIVLAACLMAGWARGASAQPIGTYRFQLQPFCNIVTLSIIQVGTIFTLDGFDDLCGAATRASASGTAFPNPDGTIGFGLTLVFAPHAAPIHIDATINLATLVGTWHDSVGYSGALVISPASTSGSPRPAPVAGTVVPATQFSFGVDGGFVARGEHGVGTLGATGAGTRVMWHPAKSAFRAGGVSGTQWDDAQIGSYSVGLGGSTIASGDGSVAMGLDTTASSLGSVAMGFDATASGESAVAMGHNTTASGTASLAIGWNTTATGSYGAALGFDVHASGLGSVALGSHASTNSHQGAFVFSDTSNAAFTNASANNQFTVRSAGGVRFFSNNTMTMGVKLDAGAGAWTQISDAARKRDFRDLDGEDVLLTLRAMPIREWSYISQDPAIRHVGPTAQDFRAGFGLGEDPLGITTIDAEGIALRAIQALEVRTATLREENLHLAAENASLRRALDEIRQELASLRPRERR